MKPEIPAAFRGSHPQILILDVDGVLTKNFIHIDGEGRETKSFFVPDGMGIKLVQAIGVEVCLMSGRRSSVVAARAKELGITRHQAGTLKKGAAMEQLLKETGIDPQNAVYVGDDLIDLAPMGRVGLPVAVADAQPLVLEKACAVTSKCGGEGAVREVCEWILVARDEWSTTIERFDR